MDVLTATARRHPHAPALDNGRAVLTYEEFLETARELADLMAERGVGRGDRVGVRIPSGTTDLYVAIVATVLCGACYVPVDHDDPRERADLVFSEAQVALVIGTDLALRPGPAAPGASPSTPRPEDDAWVIFTSGSTGTPKGVAVSHRSAAAFVDAEARWFLQDEPLGPQDRVMAGLSVAFDASCEEMWLAWGHGACLVPAPRSLVRSGMDLGPWLTANGVTVVSTVPTLAALWPPEALAGVRLLIFGGEACPRELAERLAVPGREVWNTYGPTEATVVACGTRLAPDEPVRIGLPLDGWDLAVVGPDGAPVADGDVGELVIGGVGLARYLDPARDAVAYAPLPALGWERAYRSGDLVRFDGTGLLFEGRADDQVKVGGRRIELGEVDSALLAVPGVVGAAAAVRRTGSGNSLLVGYVTTDGSFDRAAATAHLRETMPAALVPRIAEVETLPTRTSGKIDRDALPWPLPAGGGAGFDGTAGRLAAMWADILGAPPEREDVDFFDLGGGSLTAAQLVSRLRSEHPTVTVAAIYDHPRLADLAAHLDGLAGPDGALNDEVSPIPLSSSLVQGTVSVLVRALAGLRWAVWVGLGVLALQPFDPPSWLPSLDGRWIAVGWLLLVSPPGRVLLAALLARLVLLGVRPGDHPRGGSVHLRVWAAERIVDEVGAGNLSAAPLVKVYARLLGCRVGRGVDLHSLPPVSGLLTLGAAASVEPEVDLAGHWVEGGTFRLGRVGVGAGARVGARSTLLPGADIGVRAEVAPGSAVFGAVPAGQAWSGAPAAPVGRARGPWDTHRPARRPWWLAAYAASAGGLALLPVLAGIAGAAVAAPAVLGADSLSAAWWAALLWVPVASLVAFVVLAVLILAVVRAFSVGLRPGHYPVHGSHAWRAWSVLRVLDEARTWLFPLYSSSLTPLWLRLLGARVGGDVEASTVLLIPRFVTVGRGAFLADDTLVGGYELGGGWLRVEEVAVGKGAFVGNSGMAAPGRKVPKRALVAVLSAAPQRGTAKSGTSWLGSPPQPLRREAGSADASRTVAPPARLRVARALVELARAGAVWAHAWTVVTVTALVLLLVDRGGAWTVLVGPVLVVAGAVAAGVAVLAKWALVGRLRPSEHPLWSSFVWRNELADTFVEVLAAPWFARAATGTLSLNLWLRAMGASVGRGVWCETYWLPEADLIHLGDGATVGRGCVVQTHLFHDRVLAMDHVRVGRGGTLGPNSVILPAASIGRHASVGPVSLVMRGESLPEGTRWIGNPVGPWTEPE